MKLLSGIFGIRREERWVVPVALLLMVVLNGMMVAYRHEIFTRPHIGYWSAFYNYYMLSGYDDLTYVTLSSWKVYYSLYRHPLLALLMYPPYLLNDWLMDTFDINFAVYIVAAMLVVCDVWSFVFMRRIVREVVGLRPFDATLLAFTLFSFAHIMVAAFAPDHFGISLFLLMLTLYVAGRRLREGSGMGTKTTALLFLFTSGVTLTNGVKTLLAALWCGGRRFFSLRSVGVSVVLPLLILGGAYAYQYYAISQPGKERDEARMQERLRTDKEYARKIAEHKKWLDEHAGEKLIDNPLFEWTDKETSRLDAAVENLFGESVQLHRSYLLQDTNRTRPNYVPYDNVWYYIVEGVVVALFAAGVWLGRRDRFMQLCLSWFAFDMVLHFVLGFGILEVYIMAAHWIFIIPIAYAFLLRRFDDTCRMGLCLRAVLTVLTAYLMVYNGTLVAGYLL